MRGQTIFGINAVRSRLQLGHGGIEQLMVRAGALSPRLQQIVDLATEIGCEVNRVDMDQLDNMTGVTHQGVGLRLKPPKAIHEAALDRLVEENEDLLLLMLDGVTDPRNLGACLRSAAALGAHAVVVPKNNSAPLNDAAIKTASGGASYVPLIQVINLARCMDRLQKLGVWMVGTLLDAEQSITEVDLCGKIALVMGSEEKGLRSNTVKHCDFLANIPMLNEQFGFNVSVAAGICLYEVNRQRTDTR